MAIELAVVTGSADLLVGLVLGLCVGLLVAPAFRSWQIHLEWEEASREARLTERLLRKLEDDAEDAPSSDPAADASSQSPGGEVAQAGKGSGPRAGAPWPTSR